MSNIKDNTSICFYCSHLVEVDYQSDDDESIFCSKKSQIDVTKVKECDNFDEIGRKKC
jgi:hypothetical protein